MRPRLHREHHLVGRVGWLRAAVLGANDGIVSTASLLVGVGAANPSRDAMIIAGVAGLVAGAMSMAAGEYVSVSSQADAEAADLARERRELRDEPDRELAELAGIYEGRGLDPDLAMTVAKQLSSRDRLGAHMRDELGISETMSARPVQAALTSAVTFAVGAALPLLTVVVAPAAIATYATAVVALVSLAILGAFGASMGGAAVMRATVRVTFWGAVAMAVTAAIGKFFGAVV